MVEKVKIIGDFHIHSRFSIATSKKLIPEYLDYWAARDCSNGREHFPPGA